MSDHERRLRQAAEALTAAHQARDEAILAAAADGIPKSRIAAAVGLSRMQVHRLTAAEQE